MKQKIFLTSVIAMGFVAPAMAEPSNTDTFPQDGLMLEDYTYTNAATSTNMAGVYEGTVNAEAQYSDILYTIGAGKYLPAGAEAVIDCNVPGSFCPGLQSQVTYDANNNQGLTSCSTVGDGSYTLSDGTGSANTSCYKTCSASCTQPSAPAHSTNVSYGTETASGNQYYGSSCNAVAPTCSINFDCVNGYHKNAADVVAKTPVVPLVYNQKEEPTGGGAISFNGSSYGNPENYEMTDNGTWVVEYSNGILYGSSSCQQSMVGVVDIGYMEQNLGAVFEGNITMSEFKTNLASLGFSNDKINITENLYNQIVNGAVTDEDEVFAKFVFLLGSDTGSKYTRNSNGQYCFCNVDGWKTSGETKQNITDTPWVFYYEGDENTPCSDYCAQGCMLAASMSEIHRGAMFGAFGVASTSCEANTITINWTGTSETEINANNAGTATYGSDIRTPRSATPVPGKTFTGWRFVAPQQASVQEP